ncbi:MAG: hypothetical protein DMNBKLKJ_00389 [Candidatus Westeberhardia cardiocondylae]|nr:hypothetical protein [Candidatus Westeberhardia cardiocondylae]
MKCFLHGIYIYYDILSEYLLYIIYGKYLLCYCNNIFYDNIIVIFEKFLFIIYNIIYFVEFLSFILYVII